MTPEQHSDVKEAVNQMYTLRDIYWKISNMDWTVEMFESFINQIAAQQRKMAVKY